VTTTVAQLADTLQTLFTTTAQQLATDTGLVRRRRQLSGPSFAQGLVFAWLDDPDATLEDLARAAAPAGAALAPQSLDERFTPTAAEFLRRLLLAAVGHVVAAQPTAVALLRRFTGVYLLDSTGVALPAALADLWPGCGGRGDPAVGRAALKVQVCYELNTGALTGLSLHPGRAADGTAALARQPLPAGSLRLADLGYFDLDVLQSYDRQKVYFVSRLQPKTTLYDADGRKWQLGALLAARSADRLDEWVALGGQQRLRCRLLAIRAPAAVAAKRRRRLAAQAAKHGRRASAAGLALCDWTVFVCNAPGWLLSLQEAWVLYRVRWQVELLFKLWKSHGRVAESRSGQAYRVLCEVYAKLLAMVVQHWLLLSGGGGFSERSQRKAARLVRRQAMRVAAALGRRRELRRVLRALAGLLRRGGRVNRRRRRPSTYQTLVNPAHDGLT
jgi:Transposase DDE domain